MLVDDYQDTDFAQGALLALLCEEAREVTVTGPAPALAEFARAFPEAPTVVLDRSMRCPRAIVTASRAAEQSDEAIEAREGGSVRFWRCASERAQAQAIAAAAAGLIAAGTDPTVWPC